MICPARFFPIVYAVDVNARFIVNRTRNKTRTLYLRRAIESSRINWAKLLKQFSAISKWKTRASSNCMCDVRSERKTTVDIRNGNDRFFFFF